MTPLPVTQRPATHDEHGGNHSPAGPWSRGPAGYPRNTARVTGTGPATRAVLRRLYGHSYLTDRAATAMVAATEAAIAARVAAYATDRAEAAAIAAGLDLPAATVAVPYAALTAASFEYDAYADRLRSALWATDEPATVAPIWPDDE